MQPFERRLLRVNLSDRKAEIDSIPHDVVMSFVGGRDFGIKDLYEELSSGIDPLGPENKLVFITGPLAGSGAHSLSKCRGWQRGKDSASAPVILGLSPNDFDMGNVGLFKEEEI